MFAFHVAVPQATVSLGSRDIWFPSAESTYIGPLLHSKYLYLLL